MRRKAPTERPEHPTKSALLKAAAELLDEAPLDQITSDMVLQRAGARSGSLYHFFQDFPDLLEQALVARTASAIDESIRAFRVGFSSSTTAADLRLVLQQVTRSTQESNRSTRRSQRIITIAQATQSPRLMQRLGVEQRRLTAALTEMIAEAQDVGWIRSELAPQAIAAFIQAYTLGRVIDDIDPEPVHDDAWIGVVDHFVDSLLSQLLVDSPTDADKTVRQRRARISP